MDSSANARVWDFFLSGGIFMAFIVICSFVAITVAIHRALSLRWNAVIPSTFETELLRCSEYFRQRKGSRLFIAMKRDASPLAHLARVCLSPEFKTREEATSAVESSAREQVVKLENGLGVLEVIVTIAPLLGLLGTVSGLVSVFATLGAAGNESDPALIAGGIAVALNTTIAGLVVAVVTVIAYTYFSRKLERIAARLEVISSHVIHEFYRHGGPAIYDQEPEDAAADEAPAREEPDPALLASMRGDGSTSVNQVGGNAPSVLPQPAPRPAESPES
ncbi:MAG: MotA/TolQ/ExbB proton channel family protein [Verrucomicrobiota bacterium]